MGRYLNTWVLLVLARAFQFDKKPGEDEDGKTAIVSSLEAVLCGLPDNLVRTHVGTRGAKIDR